MITQNTIKKNGQNYNFFLQSKSYIKSINTKQSPLVSIKDGINSVKVVDAIYKSINLNKAIKIKY